jgi:iron complex outermembrane receptor protein
LKYTRGYKSGGFNVRPSTVQRFQEGFGPEKLVTVEAGAKTQWLDDRIRFNLAVFHSAYDDIQINTQSDYTNPTYSDILNAGKATITGAEIEFNAVVTESLTFGLNYAYLDAAYDKIENALGADVTRDYIFADAPHNSLIANIDYAIATTPIGDLRANVNYSWQSAMLTTTSTVAGKWGIDGYGLLNGRLTLADIPGLPAGKLRISLWGKNLDNETYSVIHAPGFNGYRAFGEPRSAGVDLVYEY